MSTFWKAVETFLIGLAVVVVGAVIQGVSNYHPIGIAADIWAVVSVAVIGGLRALLSFLIIKQGTTTEVASTTITTKSTITSPDKTT